MPRHADASRATALLLRAIDDGITPRTRGVESRPFGAAIAINIGRYVSAAVINTILVIGRRSAIRTDGQSGCDAA